MKAHDEIPDGIGIGVREERNTNGELVIYLKGSRTTKDAAWIVLGKYAEPRDDGKIYYVADRTETHWADVAVTTYHEHLLMAVARVYEFQTRYKDHHHENDDDKTEG
jgi:hypothetical protein